MEKRREFVGAVGGTSMIDSSQPLPTAVPAAVIGPCPWGLWSALAPVGLRFRIALVAAVLQAGGGPSLPWLALPGDAPAAMAQNQRPPADDPFAEELNPFPREEKPKPRSGQTPRATGPGTKKPAEKNRENVDNQDPDEELTEPAPRQPAPRGKAPERVPLDADDEPPIVRPRPMAKPLVPAADLLPFPDVGALRTAIERCIAMPSAELHRLQSASIAKARTCTWDLVTAKTIAAIQSRRDKVSP